MTLRLEWRLLDDFHHRFQVACVVSDEFVVHGCGDELEIVGKLGYPWKVDGREDLAGGGIRDVGEPESRSDSVDSKGLADVGLCECVV